MLRTLLFTVVFLTACNGTTDDGTGTCDPSCTCAGDTCICGPDATCDMGCDSSTCTIECQAASDCATDCGTSGTCTVDCVESAACNVTCPDSGMCTVKCPETGCTVNNCDMLGGNCVVQCGATTGDLPTFSGTTATCP